MSEPTKAEIEAAAQAAAEAERVGWAELANEERLKVIDLEAENESLKTDKAVLWAENDALRERAELAERRNLLNPSATEYVTELEAKLAAAEAERDELGDQLDAARGWPWSFVLQRDEDETGVSGTGVVAEGVEFSDHSVALRWISDWPTSVVFHDRGMESVEAVHGHGGKTRIMFTPPLDARTPYCSKLAAAEAVIEAVEAHLADDLDLERATKLDDALAAYRAKETEA